LPTPFFDSLGTCVFKGNTGSKWHPDYRLHRVQQPFSLGLDSVLRKRLARRKEKASITDARLRHLEAMRQAFEPLTDLEADTYLQVETDQPLEQSLQYILPADYKLLKQQAHDT